MKLNETQKKYFLDLKPEDITFDLLLDLFADKKGGPSKYETWDEMDLKKGEYFNKVDLTTNIGLFIFNKLLIERDLTHVVDYINTPMNGKSLKKLNNTISKALLYDKITSDVMIKYLNRTQWLLMKLNSVLTPSFTEKMIEPIPSVIKRRDELFKQYKEEIDAGNIEVITKISNELISMAKEELKGDDGMLLYDSGARGSFENNYKNLSIMRGAILNSSTGKYETVQKSFSEGFDKKDFPAMGTSVISGAYPKAVGTAVSGYLTKQLLAALQTVRTTDENYDCGSTGYLPVTLTSDNFDDYLFRYIIEGKKLVLLSDENKSKYVNTTVKMRSPMFCKNPVCKICCGIYFEKIGISNVGLTATKMTSTLLNMNMKKFHDSSVKLHTIKSTKDLFIPCE